MSKDKKKIAIALQGGGAYGAFTWGVLERLLEEDDIEITGISGVSAGALNAIAVVNGLDRGGRKEAIEDLRKLWEEISYDDLWDDIPGAKTSRRIGDKLKEVDPTNFLKKIEPNMQAGMAAIVGLSLTKKFKEKVREMRIQKRVDKVIDFEKVNKNKSGIPIYIGTSDLENSRDVVFTRDKLSPDVIAASCAIPGLFPPVKIDGINYWDGGMSDNPVMAPLKENIADDILIVQTVPKDASKKNKESDKIKLSKKVSIHYMNGSIRKDVETIQIDNQKYDRNPAAAESIGLKKINTHLISNENAPDVTGLNFLHFKLESLEAMKQDGYDSADTWIKNNKASIGIKSSYTIDNSALKKPEVLKPIKEKKKFFKF